MTTLFVPLQNWAGKGLNHLKFQFCLDKWGKEMINVSMVPPLFITAPLL